MRVRVSVSSHVPHFVWRRGLFPLPLLLLLPASVCVCVIASRVCTQERRAAAVLSPCRLLTVCVCMYVDMRISFARVRVFVCQALAVAARLSVLLTLGATQAACLLRTHVTSVQAHILPSLLSACIVCASPTPSPLSSDPFGVACPLSFLLHSRVRLHLPFLLLFFPSLPLFPWSHRLRADICSMSPRIISPFLPFPPPLSQTLAMCFPVIPWPMKGLRVDVVSPSSLLLCLPPSSLFLFRQQRWSRERCTGPKEQ